MNRARFIAAVKKSGLTWFLCDDEGGQSIRAEVRGMALCPINAVALLAGHGLFSSVDYQGAAESLGVGECLAEKIATAADNDVGSGGSDSEFREELLVATGLKELATIEPELTVA
jgi:hypothetical protein